MNRIVKIAGIALTSLLVVVGTVWAQTGVQWKAPTLPFPFQDIPTIIDTGAVEQSRLGVINFPSSTVPTYSLLFGSNTGNGINVGGGSFVLNGSLKLASPVKISDPPKAIVFQDGTVQTEAAYGQFNFGKFCSVISPGNWRDSFLVIDRFTRAACQKYMTDTSASRWSLGCLSGSGVRWGPSDGVPPTPNCGWDTPAVPPPPDTCYYYYTDASGNPHYKPPYRCP